MIFFPLIVAYYLCGVCRTKSHESVCLCRRSALKYKQHRKENDNERSRHPFFTSWNYDQSSEKQYFSIRILDCVLWHHHRNRNAGRAVDRPVRYKAQRAGSRTLSGFCTVRDHMFRYRCKIVLCDFRVGLL